MYTTAERLKRWRNFGVIPAFIPVVIAVLYDAYLGYTFSQIVVRRFPDFILVVFAISVGVFSSANDLERGLEGKVREKFMASSAISAVLSFALYSFLYEREDPQAAGWMIAFRIGIVLLSIYIIRVGFNVEEETAVTDDHAKTS